MELMEQFLNAGFDRETSIKMLHSVMLLRDSSCFSTMDLAAVNLYAGECELLKVGAAATFLKRGELGGDRFLDEHAHGDYRGGGLRVSRKSSSGPEISLSWSPTGFWTLSREITGRTRSRSSILNETTDNAAEMAKNILEEVLKFRRRKAEDDMTVLVGGLWRR